MNERMVLDARLAFGGAEEDDLGADDALGDGDEDDTDE